MAVKCSVSTYHVPTCHVSTCHVSTRIYFLYAMSSETTQICFLLNHHFRDRNNRFEMTLYAVNGEQVPVKIVVDSFRPLFFVPRTTPQAATTGAMERKELPLKAMAGGTPVDCLYFATYGAFVDCGRNLRQKGICVYESDVHPVERYLMERLVKGGFEAIGRWERNAGFLSCRNPRINGTVMTPVLSVLSFDIETNAESNEILSIACSGKQDIVFMQGSGRDISPVSFCRSEKELLLRFFDHLKSEDPDVCIGWNVVDFDLRVIQERCESLRIPFRPGRDEGSKIVESKITAQKIARIPGRAVMDVPSMLRATYHAFEEYSLDFVASEMLGKNKLIRLTGKAKIDEINRRFREDPVSLAEYNLNDAQLTKEIFTAAGILPNAVERSKRSGHLLDRLGGSVAAFDYLYLPRLHRAGYVAPDSADVKPPSGPLPGGYVQEPKPGLYENVLAFDFRSLYPSIIMTFKIDPLGLVAPSQNRIQGPADLRLPPMFLSFPESSPSLWMPALRLNGKITRTCPRQSDPHEQLLRRAWRNRMPFLFTGACRRHHHDRTVYLQTDQGAYSIVNRLSGDLRRHGLAVRASGRR